MGRSKDCDAVLGDCGRIRDCGSFPRSAGRDNLDVRRWLDDEGAIEGGVRYFICDSPRDVAGVIYDG